jgi:hypothetical protein
VVQGTDVDGRLRARGIHRIGPGGGIGCAVASPAGRAAARLARVAIANASMVYNPTAFIPASG